MFRIPSINRSNRSRRADSRRGASTVEFAMLAPIFFITTFACLEFGRVMIVEAFVENATYQAARNVSVFGAKKAEAIEIVKSELAMIGISDPKITINPYSNGNLQGAITDGTDSIEVEVFIEKSNFSAIMPVISLRKSAFSSTERINF